MSDLTILRKEAGRYSIVAIASYSKLPYTTVVSALKPGANPTAKTISAIEYGLKKLGEMAKTDKKQSASRDNQDSAVVKPGA